MLLIKHLESREPFFISGGYIICKRVIKIKGCIFDLDGTLFDSMDIWSRIGPDSLKKRGITPPPDYARTIFTMSFAQSAAYTVRYFELPCTPENLMQEWDETAALVYGSEARLKPGVGDYLLALRENGWKLGVATTLHERVYRPALERHRLLGLFDVLCGADEVPLPKSDPEIFLLCAKRLGLEPGECVVFEDLLVAVRSAKSAGMQTVGVWDKASAMDWEEIKNTAGRVITSFEREDLPFLDKLRCIW